MIDLNVNKLGLLPFIRPCLWKVSAHPATRNALVKRICQLTERLNHIIATKIWNKSNKLQIDYV